MPKSTNMRSVPAETREREVRISSDPRPTRGQGTSASSVLPFLTHIVNGRFDAETTAFQFDEFDPVSRIDSHAAWDCSRNRDLAFTRVFTPKD